MTLPTITAIGNLVFEPDFGVTGFFLNNSETDGDGPTGVDEPPKPDASEI